MQFRIRRNVNGRQWVRSVPPRFRAIAELRKFPGRVDLLLFRSGRDDVIHSRIVEQALERLGATANPLAALGGCFTLEAQAILKSREAEVFSLSDFPWTDQTHKEIKISIGAKVKKPSR